MDAIGFRSACRWALLVGTLLLAGCQAAPKRPLPEGLRVMPGDGYALDRHRRDLVHFIERIGAPVHRVGQSYGAQVALSAARSRPDLVARLVLAEGGTVQDPDVPADRSAAQFAALGARTEPLFRTRGLDAGLAFAVDALAAPGNWARDPTRAALRCEQFGALPMPVLLLTGENTSPRHRALVGRQAACRPSARVATIPGVAHLVQLDAPAVAAALEAFPAEAR